MQKLLEINHCKKRFADTVVLTDLSLSVEQSQVLSIIGPSGSGKSTLLRCATLLETMDSGDLIYGGMYAARDVNGKAVYASQRELRQVRNQFGLVFQNFNLFPQGGRLSLPAFRRTAAAGLHRPCAGHEPQDPLF